MTKLLITLVHSAHNSKKKQKATVEALGLRKVGDQVLQENNDAILGMCHNVNHLVTVEEVEVE